MIVDVGDPAPGGGFEFGKVVAGGVVGDVGLEYCDGGDGEVLAGEGCGSAEEEGGCEVGDVGLEVAEGAGDGGCGESDGEPKVEVDGGGGDDGEAAVGGGGAWLFGGDDDGFVVVFVEVVEGFGDGVGDAVDGGEEGFGHDGDAVASATHVGCFLLVVSVASGALVLVMTVVLVGVFGLVWFLWFACFARRKCRGPRMANQRALVMRVVTAAELRAGMMASVHLRPDTFTSSGLLRA